ncbi:reverse transcriptase [Gossypium australe]|uniref:Reverse transcriptase n=1 Tax=Gossypium australe TaxID=47621 RepID=A0A5B6UV02_9ROSI|nr:reverse transcriptase [Gossypium australe]
MDPRKAPGIDGLSGNFFKHHWDIAHKYIYKIIAKVLANRLKVILPNCISYNQSAFVSGRMIHDNILITHELFHYHLNTLYNSNK